MITKNLVVNHTETVDAFYATKHIAENMTFGSLIKSLRLCDEVTQIELARKLDVSKQFLSDVEHDRKDIGIEFAKKCSIALGYPVEPFIQILIQSQLKKYKLKCVVEVRQAV